jgi:hypothetical protein
MKRLIKLLAIGSTACASLTSAIVLAQATKVSDPPLATGAKNAATTDDKSPGRLVLEDVAPPPAAPKAKAAAQEVIRKDLPAPAPAARGIAGQVLVRKRVAAMGNQGNRAPLLQQSKTQVRPAVRAELILVLRVCQLSALELRRINRDAQEVVDDVISKVVDAQLQPRVITLGKAEARPNLDGGKLLQDGLSAVFKKHLAPEQWSKYEVERDKRDAYRKQSTIRFLIDVIDRELYLSPQQRTKLQESLSSHWDNGWQLYVDYLLFGNQFYPMNVDPLVNPILSDAQKKVWQNVQKVDGYWGFGGVWGGFGNDSDELEEERGEQPKQANDPGKAIQKMKAAKSVIKRVDAIEK